PGGRGLPRRRHRRDYLLDALLGPHALHVVLGRAHGDPSHHVHRGGGNVPVRGDQEGVVFVRPEQQQRRRQRRQYLWFFVGRVGAGMSDSR
ncbi:unnamed protein product, partial [Ectocarpus sp. 12 AP-2014]